MNPKTLTQHAFFASCLALLSTTACAERECTDEEREEAGADENDDCTRYVPLVTFDADESETVREGWEPGDGVILTGDIRAVRVVEGNSDDEVVIVWRGQVALAEGREKDVVEATLDNLTTELRRSGSNIRFSASRNDSSADLGAAVTVQLPSGFDGVFEIDKRKARGGNVRIDYLGDAAELRVDMNDLGGDLDLGGVSGVRRAIINTRGDISMRGAFSSALEAAVIHSHFGDVEARFSGVPESHVRIVTEFGDIDVNVPGSEDFTLSGVSDGRSVTFSNPPSGCLTRTNSPTSKDLLCNAGDPGGLTFDLEADGDITVSF